MSKVITQFLVKFPLFFLILFTSCVQNSQNAENLKEKPTKRAEEAHDKLQKIKKTKMLLPSGAAIEVFLALRESEKVQGLSGIQDNQFADNQSMLFYYKDVGERRFWMPDTYFNLDIFFLDQNFVVLDVVRNIKAHPGRQTPPEIATTPVIEAWHVLELKASSALSKEIQKGHKIIWQDPLPSSEIEAYIHQGQ